MAKYKVKISLKAKQQDKTVTPNTDDRDNNRILKITCMKIWQTPDNGTFGNL